MAFEKSKILKNAEKFVATGKISQAIDEYLKILKENPKDWNLMIQIGDLLLKVNRTEEAIESFQKVADHYYEDGFHLKAIAIYKRINKLNPSLTDICMRLADLYLKQGLTMDAKSQLQVVAQHYLSKNQNKDAIETLQRLIEIEPDNLKNRNELAKAYKSEGMIPEATQEYLKISEELTSKNLFKECIAVLETAYKLDIRNVEVLQKLLALYQDQKEQEKAIVLLEDALKADPSNPDVLAVAAETYGSRKDWEKAHDVVDRALLNAGNREPLWELKGDLHLKQGKIEEAYQQYHLVVEKEVQRKDIDRAVFLMQQITETDTSFFGAWERLVELYTMLRQQANLITAYGNLADAYISKLMYREAAESLEKLIKLDPDDNQHREKLKFVSSHFEETKSGIKEPERVYEAETEPSRSSPFTTVNVTGEPLPGSPALQAQHEKTVLQPMPATSAKPASPAAAMSTIVTSEEKEFVSEHLIEAEVFNKYGLVDKAIEQLHSIIKKYPDSVPTRQKLKEIYLEKGERDKAVEECIQMSRIFHAHGDKDQAEDLLSEGRQINPNHSSLDRAFRDLAEKGATLTRGTVSPPPAAVMPPESVTQPVVSKQPPELQPKTSGRRSTKSVDVPALKKLDIVTKKLDARQKSAEVSRATDATAAKANAALSELEKFAQKIKTQSGITRRPVTKSAEPIPSQQPVVQPKAPVPGELEIEIEVEEPQASTIAVPDFEEIDFLIHQGLLTEAEKSLKVLQRDFPSNPEIQRRVDQVEKLRLPAEQKQQSAQEETVSGPEIEVPMIEIPPTLESSPEDEIVISMDEESIQEASKPVDVSPAIEALPEINLPVTDSSEEIALAVESLEPSLEPSIEMPQPQVDESKFTEFSELEDSTEVSLSEVNPEVDESFVESFNDAVDAVFKFEEPVPAVSPAAPEESPKLVKEELFEEEDDFFDLAAELEEGLLSVQSAVEADRPPDGQNYSIEEILTDFKKGVDKQLGTEDYDTRYNLGIAYKEMGLVDEAIAEFQIAAKDPRRLLECCSMLGLCFVEKGMPKLAIKWYQKGLENPGYSEEEYQGLRYDLAAAHETLGEYDRALEIYQEVYGVNANYRNVAKKIKELREKKSS